MRTCYLHLGMPKTGSTAIQLSFAGYEDRGVSYARLRQKNHQAPICLKFSVTPFRLPSVRKRELGNGPTTARVMAARLTLKRAVASSKSTIFSGEGILDKLEPEEVADMLAFFKSRYDRLVPIIYVRPLASLASSQFQQRVKMGHCTFKIPKPNYRRRFEPVVNSSDVDEIKFVRFDRASLIGGDVVTDFAHRVGATSVPKTVAVVNQSLSTEAVGALYGFNKYTGWQLPPKQHTRMLRTMFKTLQRQGERKFGFSRDLLEKHLETCAKDIAWIEDITGFDVTGDIMPVDEPVQSEDHLLSIAAELSKARQKKFRAGSALPGCLADP